MNYRRILGAAALTLLLGTSAWAQLENIFGLAQPEQPGSLLIVPKFDISDGTSTQIRITNIHETAYISVKLNYVCPGIKRVDDRCRALDRTVKLTPHQTRIIDVADHNPPCERGFVVAFAQNYGLLVEETPISFNYLIGSYHISRERTLSSENAIAVQSPYPCFTPLEYIPTLQDDDDDDDLTIEEGLRFSPVGPYLTFGSELYTDFQAVDNVLDVGSRLVLLSLDILAGQQNPATSVYIDFWNAVEVPFSTSHEFVCWDQTRLDNIDVNFLAENLGTEYGSMTIGAIPNCPLPGGCPPLEPYDPIVLGAIEEYVDDCATGIRNLYTNDWPKCTTYVPR